MNFEIEPTLTPTKLNDDVLSSLPWMKKASRHLAAAARRARIRRVWLAIMVVATLGAIPRSNAATVTMTFEGQVLSGSDGSGVFGFTPGTALRGQTFKLVFTFDDTKGTQTTEVIEGVTCGSSIKTVGLSSPGTAVLQIGSGSWTFGTAPGPYNAQSSYAIRSVGECRGVMSNGVSDGPSGTSGGSVTDGVTLDIGDTTGTIPTTDYHWQDAFSASGLTNGGGVFIIATTSGANASGSLFPTSVTVSGGPSQGPGATGLQFIPVTPCRVADTRNAAGPFGGPELAAGASREFDIPQSGCSIPSSAVAYSLNLTAVPTGALGYLTMWPSGQTQPTVSTLNSDGRVKANAAITPAGTNGGVSVFVTNPSHVILDINGYFVPAGTASALAFYPVTPCRVADTRNAPGPFGGPSLAAASSRDFSLQSSSCALPSDAKAYSLNVTAVPKGGLGYLTMWPSGEAQPLVSTLNSPTGAVTANAAIVPAGSNGDVSVYVSNASDVIVDVNGYFAAPSANGLSLYTTTPCRVIDTRNGSGAFNGTFAVDVESSTCAPSSTAQAYVLNATVVPTGSLGFLTLWPAGQTQPVVSTLNASDGVVTSNMAVVPTMNGSIDAFSSSATQLILDLSSYFAP
jgi:hypothetical protein